MSGDTTEPKTAWNGATLGPWNRVALAWAWQMMPRLRELGLDDLDHKVLMSLAAHTGLDGKNEAWPGQETIAAETGVKLRRVTSAIKRLRSSAVISATKIPGTNSNRYVILPEIGEHKWVSRIPCSSAQNAVMHRMRDSDACRALPVTHGVRDISAQNAHEQEHLTGALEQEQGKGASVDGRLVGRSAPVGQEINPDDLNDTPAQPAKPKPAQPAKPKLTLTPTGKFSGQPQTSNPDPAQELASWFHHLIGSPAREAKAAKTVWAGTLRPLIDEYGMETVKAAITWASDSTFWPDKLCRRDGDSAEYALDKFSTWLDQRANEAERRIRKPAQSSIYKPVEYPAAASYRSAGQPKISIGIDPTR